MDTKEKIVSENLGLVHACAKRFKGRGIEYDDLYQSGCLALVKAIDGFDESKGFKFSTYAVPVILGEMKRLFRDGGTVKVGRSLKELSLKATKACDKFRVENEREATISELAEILGVETAKAAEAVSAGMVPLSLTSSDDDSGSQIDIAVESPDEKVSELLALKQIIGELEPKDRTIIILRFFRNYTQTQVAKLLGMTQVQVSRREKAILNVMRKKLQE